MTEQENHTQDNATGQQPDSNEQQTQQRPRRRRGRRSRRKNRFSPANQPNGGASGESGAELPDSDEAAAATEALTESSGSTQPVTREGTAPEESPDDHQAPESPVATKLSAPAASAGAFGEGVVPASPPPPETPAGELRRRRSRRGGRGRRRRHQTQEAGQLQTGQTGVPATGDDASNRSLPSRPPQRQDRQPQPVLVGQQEGREDELEDVDEGPEEPRPTGDRVMLINAADGDECRIAVLHQRRLEELFIERASAESHVGNIYKGRITNVEPSIQAAFVDFGLPKNGFLHISDLQPQYFPNNRGQMEEVGRKTPRRERPPIQKCLRRGQEVLVQIIKEGIGTKGPTLTTYISIPGRYLVMMPGMNKLGVSRRIEDEEARRKMRKLLDELNLPKNMGFILRTAGLDKTKRELQRDQMYLQRLWKRVAQKIKTDRAPCELYQESDLVIRTIRDVYTPDFGKIIVDNEATAEKVRDFLAIAMPRSSAPVEVYTGPDPLFHKYGLEAEIEKINARHVALPSGGSLVIDSTEAMVAIDVNSGRFREHEDAEETAFRTDLEAAEEIARQLRLRDLGGLIVCDFIDLIQEKHRRAVERALRDALKKHKERAKCLRMSQFGIVEMTRQRIRPSIKRSIYQDCPHCRGSGLVKNPESMTLDIMRLLRVAAHHELVETVEIRVAPEVAFQLQNRKRSAIHETERQTGRHIVIRADSNIGLDQFVFSCFDKRGGAIRALEMAEAAGPHPGHRPKHQPPPPPQLQHHEPEPDRDQDENMFE
jgi:ribonuclease E